MAKLFYSMITSLDGYIADEEGNFDWGTPDDELFEYVTELERSVGTALYGRRMYETMAYWETIDDTDEPPHIRDFVALWRSQTKIVYSSTLTEPSTTNTRIEHAFVPDDVRRLKESATKDLSIAGPHLASQAIEAKLVDEMHLFVTPITVGGGTSAHPGESHTELELLSVTTFKSGVVHLHYRFQD